MSLIIPNTFAVRTSDLQLSELDTNFTYLSTQLDTTNSTIDNLLSSIQVSPGNTTIAGQITLQQISEIINTKTNATSTVVHDFSTGAIWFHSSVASNFTANITNAPTANNRALSIAIIINQGGTGYYPNAIQIDGVAQTILWQGNITPTPSVNRIDVYSFNLIRTNNTWFILGAVTGH